ncbi:MAG: dTMP kinase [Chloroflexi bacterium]|nr:dTMP kinase [Chloroflexota bacterium]
MARFIVFEGGDGSGKSTQSRSLYRRLQRRGYPTILTREPGGTPTGESIRRWLKSRQALSPLSELLLFEAARAQLAVSVIRPALEKGTTVVGDRFTASTVAYQGYGRELDLDLISRLNRVATGGLAADLTVLLDVPVEVSLARRDRISPDRFDTASVEFHRRVRKGYLAQAEAEPDKWLVLDGVRPPRELSSEIWAKVQPLL